MLKKFFVAAALGVMLLQPCLPLNMTLPIAHASGITNYEGLVTPDYWTKQNPQGNQLILDANGVTALNRAIREASPSVTDFMTYPDSVSGDTLRTMIMNYAVLEDDLYLHGNKVSDNYKNILRKQTNTAAIATKNTVRYAVTVRRTPVRNLPTGEGLFYYAADTDFDALQETMLDPGEPLLVLHQSANKFFYYVQSVNYSGWVSSFNLAFTDKKTWAEYVNPEKFLVVTGADIKLKTENEIVLYQQGARLPLASKDDKYYGVWAPVRDKQNNLQKLKLILPQSAEVHEGYLPYTSNNVVRAAFKFYNKPYGWGGLKDSVDCSSLLFNAYRTVGIILPRNADEQEESAGIGVDLATVSDRAAAINKLMPGAGLYMDGHSIMYIGKVNEVPYGIHALGTYVNKNGKQREMKVVVSDFSLLRGNGDTMLKSLSTAREFR